MLGAEVVVVVDLSVDGPHEVALRTVHHKGLAAAVGDVDNVQTLVRHVDAVVTVDIDRVAVGATVAQQLGQLENLAPVLLRVAGEAEDSEDSAHCCLVERVSST